MLPNRKPSLLLISQTCCHTENPGWRPGGLEGPLGVTASSGSPAWMPQRSQVGPEVHRDFQIHTKISQPLGQFKRLLERIKQTNWRGLPRVACWASGTPRYFTGRGSSQKGRAAVGQLSPNLGLRAAPSDHWRKWSRHVIKIDFKYF